MDAADPLRAASSPTRLLRRTLGPAPRASPSKAHEALLHAISRPLKGSKELVEQARMAMKEHGDIRMLYQDDGEKARAPTNVKKDQQGRRPGLDCKRTKFTFKAPASKPVPVVDHSKLLDIKDPVEYFKALDRLDEAEKEIKRLNGEVVDDKLYKLEPLDKPKRRPGLPGRKSVFTFKFTADCDTEDPVEVPASQTGIMTESQLSQDDAYALVSEKNKQFVPSRSGERGISDASTKEDSFAEKNDGDDLTYILTSLQNLDESEEEDFFRKTLGIEELRMEKVYLCDSIPGDRSIRSNTVQKSPVRVRNPERPLPGSREARIAELEERFFLGDAAKDKCTDISEDDESEGSPDIVMSERSLVHDSSQAAEDNFQHMEDNVTIDYPTIDMSNNETEVSSSHQLEGSLTEVLVSTPGRNVAPDGIDRTSQAAEDSFQHMEVAEEDGVLKDVSSHPSEIRQANFDSENQHHADDVSIEQQTVGMSNALSPKRAKRQKGAQRRNKSEKLNRRKSLTDAGLAWQSGVRRSTRIRSRPLQHWLGERFVYGRIHDTMATVIGIKAYSPGQGGKKALKVKSFVSEKYSDLVAEAAKY